MFTYKELISLAIGSPETGHVNFYAMQVLLTCFAQRLEVLDKIVEQDGSSGFFTPGTNSKFRLFAGADAEEEAPLEPPVKEAPVEPVEVEAPVEPPVKEAPVEPNEVEAIVEPAKAEAPVEPAKENAPVEPAEEKAPVDPAEEKTPVKPAEEKTPVDPAEKGGAPEAADEKANVDPAEEKAPVEPTENEAPKEPATPVEKVLPPPIEEEAKSEKISVITQTPVTLTQPSAPANADQEAETSEAARYSTRSTKRTDFRMSVADLQKEKAFIEMQGHVSHIKAQLMVTMEQVNNMTHMLIDRSPDPHRIKAVRQFARQLKALTERNSDREVSISWSSYENEVVEEEDLVEEEIEESISSAPTDNSVAGQEEESDLSVGLERVHADILDIKSQLCFHTNKINELASALTKQDSQKLFAFLKELQDAMQDLNEFRNGSKESFLLMTGRITKAETQIDILKKGAVRVDEQKCDRIEVELLLAEKVSFTQLASKISLEQLEDYKVVMDRTFCELRNVISLNERNVLEIIDGQRMSLGIDSMELGIKDFRNAVEKKVAVLADALQNYMTMTSDECAAAAGRVKVLQDLACLSCDNTCRMRTVERQKLPTLPTAKGSISLAPIVTYELGQIRGQGVMGYYRKDEFPHAPCAWTKPRSDGPTTKCDTRHAGGKHTIHTADEHMQKVVLSKKTSRWT